MSDNPSYFSIAPRTEQAIWRYLTTRGEPKPAEPLFATALGRPLDRTILRRLIHTTGERAGVPDAHSHRFRHTFAITFLCNGSNVFFLQTILCF